ncbi:ATP-dependent zinc metalloprotease FtsH [Tepidanaerobacter syntrophicus]|uniref:ATP-dependent zinc metalloprotease FtsH n=3 Tax=Tepidanaerobacter syntrophicus TaxID=224999 RepID=A0A0U9HDV5_9FIRM|nr:ATP-dependent zinc metalloprotease FtsH [Tepidanaerobacter syntrophicus]GAQ24997.1 cell division protease FtsH [Tepidanaerobacter syntrophicus]GLI19460.1 ATP-dependent zinc metalloprotease FtsH [Tepidanaerobacter syntrophicus]GLI51647.1 ATP-dependent zinc metalloprotease FtsH [Tepidanaerobacter syntrophicus]HHV83002.1 ATP-dependent metallopeptidase FtsH/Yme1/Tma family protein [Tepidanaerobacter syntrophicus]
MNNFFRSLSFYLLIIILILSVVQWYSNQEAAQIRLGYSELLQRLDKGEVEKIVIIENNIKGTLKDGRNFVSYVPDLTTFMAKIDKLAGSGALTVDSEPKPVTPWWTQILSPLLLMVFIFGAWYFLMQQSQGGGGRVMSFGKSKAKLHTDDKRRVTFKDVAGVDEAKEELEEVVEFLKHPKKFIELGARIPKGVLLVGPPGTGKTLLARAVAGEAGVPFFTISGSDFVEMFVGVGAARVRDLFDQAKKNAPCIIFIDEIDAVGRQRGAGLGGGHDEREQTLNQLLVEMDGFGINEGIIVIAATNRPDILDPALLRPGRFDREVVVDRPDVKGREEILKVHARNKPLAEDVELSVLARRTPGFTGADLENLMNEAALLSARRNKKKIEMPELEEAITRVIAGPEKKSRVMTERERRLVAYHEAGHAVVAHLLPTVDPVHEVSIVPRGRAGGYTMILPKEDRFFMGKNELMDQITHLLGGRVSEELVLNEISTGAQNDLERATQIARKMVMEYGMSENIGPMTLGHKQEEVFLGRDIAQGRNYSEEVAASIDKEVKNIISSCYDRARSLLSDNVNKLHKVAQALLEKEKLKENEFLEVFASA